MLRERHTAYSHTQRQSTHLEFAGREAVNNRAGEQETMSNIRNNKDEDRLAQINNELRNKKVKVDDDDTPWLPLESNPEIFTKFGHDVSNWYM